ncbi:MAG TPA: hypothetical protein VGG10_06030 [Rhizomicrobium sp.]|jgi:hypothetical protein
MPQQECAVLDDLITDLDDPLRAKGNDSRDYSPTSFPADPHLERIADGTGGKADLWACTNLMEHVRHHDVGSIGYVHEPFRDGPRVKFSRVTFNAEHTEASVGYESSFGPLAMEAWDLQLTLDTKGHWALTGWKLSLVS